MFGLHQTQEQQLSETNLCQKWVNTLSSWTIKLVAFPSHCSVTFPSSHGLLGTFSSVIASVSRSHTHTVCDVRPLCSNSPCVINPCNYIVVFFPKALIKLCNVLDLPTLRMRLPKRKVKAFPFILNVTIFKPASNAASVLRVCLW